MKIYYSCIKVTGIILILLLLIEFSALHAQTHDTSAIFVSGQIVSADSLKPIPNANIRILNTNRGTATNYKGNYSLVVHLNETIEISALGYKSVTYRVPDSLKANKYYFVMALKPDTLMLPETTIYPWATYEQFKVAFVKEIPEDSLMQRARKNIGILVESRNKIYLAPDSKSSYINVLNGWKNKAFNNGLRPSTGISIGF
jgi:hypothetical protein